MALGRRQLFVYWRVPAESADGALGAARAMQDTLRGEHPELRAGLYRRDDGRQAQATLMESYAIEGSAEGIGAALQQRIEQHAAVLRQWQSGERHSELFDAIGDP